MLEVVNIHAILYSASCFSRAQRKNFKRIAARRGQGGGMRGIVEMKTRGLVSELKYKTVLGCSGKSNLP